ncbi:histidine phosphatase family protein [Ilumatobacter sp.]|uniref:histidine phosphatase family protein n=1 Tax=Ilumatobacter sp. TaxID=1967498 RepID=UPI003B526738
MSETSSNGAGPSTDRFEAPMYLARYRERQHQGRTGERPDDHPDDRADSTEGRADAAPIYLKRFRSRDGASEPSTTPLWQRSDLATQQSLTEDNRNKEISAPPSAARQLLNDVYLIRHGETQGYSTDSGLTPQGAWQAHTYGRTLAKRMQSGETIVFRHAETNRARETAEQIHRGLVDGIEQWEKEITIVEPEPANEFRNFQFVAPDGLKDVTAAFRQYSALLEGHERTAVGDRPLWLVEMDRFWRTQQGGGDPIQHWLTIPLVHFEPPAMTVRRFWAGINRLSTEFPGARLAIATHSGCIRAFAVSALGYDPGEPYNTEHVRVKLLGDADWSDGERDATVAYRNRVQEVKVPDIDRLPTWQVHDDWSGMDGTKPAGGRPT